MKNWSKLSILLSVTTLGCNADQLGRGGGAVEPDVPARDCRYLNFDVDDQNQPIGLGQIVETAYSNDGIAIEVWRDESKTIPGLGVAFDSNNPTGGDDDLAFSGAGNLLINQECIHEDEVATGFVSEPDDEAKGAFFEFRFVEPVCIPSLALFDLDFGEEPAEIKLYDNADNLVTSHNVAPMGNNIRLDVTLPNTADCNINRMTVSISSSGAMDDVEVCRTVPAPEVWTRIFDGGGDDVGNDVDSDSQRNVIAAGTTDNGVNTDGFVRKYDRDGLLRWTALLDNGNNDRAESVAVDSADNIVVVGSVSNGTDGDLIVRKLASDSTEMWTRIFDGGGEDRAQAVAIDRNDNVVVAGVVTVAGSGDIFVRKFSSAGATVWTQTISVGANDSGFGIATDADNNVYVAGRTDNGTDFDLILRKYNAAGTEQWTRAFDGGGDDIAYDVATDNAGQVIVVGTSFNGANPDVFIRKYAANGVTQWTQSFDGGGLDAGRGVATDGGNNVIVNGHTEAATLDGWTRKYNDSGVELWTEITDRGRDDLGNGVATDLAGSVLAVGSLDNGSDLDMWLSKLRP